jgi:hypothetical protein
MKISLRESLHEERLYTQIHTWFQQRPPNHTLIQQRQKTIWSNRAIPRSRFAIAAIIL